MPFDVLKVHIGACFPQTTFLTALSEKKTDDGPPQIEEQRRRKEGSDDTGRGSVQGQAQCGPALFFRRISSVCVLEAPTEQGEAENPSGSKGAALGVGVFCLGLAESNRRSLFAKGAQPWVVSTYMASWLVSFFPTAGPSTGNSKELPT